MQKRYFLLVLLCLMGKVQAEIASPWESFVYLNDKNNDGRLSKQEFLHARTDGWEFSKPLAIPLTLQMFRELDTNHNGYIEWLPDNKRQDKYCRCIGFLVPPKNLPWE